MTKMEPLTTERLTGMREAPKYDAALVALMIEGVKDRAFPLEVAQRLEAAGYLFMLEDGTWSAPATVEAMVKGTEEWKEYTKARDKADLELHRRLLAQDKALRAKEQARRKEARARCS